MSTAGWRDFARRPGGVLVTLLVVVLLALGGRPCSMLAHADTAPPLDIHGCCHDSGTAPTSHSDGAPAPPCHDGPCLQALGQYDGADRHGPFAGEPDGSAPASVAEWLPPDWLNIAPPPPAASDPVKPPPLQRSRVLRL